jgi:hypothetical protein
MRQPNLAPEEHAEVMLLVRDAIHGNRYPFSTRVRRPKSILANLEP